jgi:hypothetical protein
MCSSKVNDIEVFRNSLTHEKYRYILELFARRVAPKSDVRDLPPDDIKRFLAWRIIAIGCVGTRAARL